ncbi:hypothetical protein CEXT_331991 [Caerostris extrusa]|uniref:Uncharacterized protein n=1 Tax=Caerostris extrusa TaxID=172846 RepID=A0AAV4VRR9_CAEEX|nr:hypothetical protein CEXT_331991 [Caerostris extrusa]
MWSAASSRNDGSSRERGKRPGEEKVSLPFLDQGHELRGKRLFTSRRLLRMLARFHSQPTHAVGDAFHFLRGLHLRYIGLDLTEKQEFGKSAKIFPMHYDNN